VGGIAHEINNPINFVHGNLKFIQQYVKDLLEVVQLYQRYYPDPVEAIQAQAEMLDLDFLLDDLPKVLESVDSGTHRVRQIIGSLRNFSRLDEAELKTVQVHEGIDSTLLILQHRLKGHNANSAIEVLKNYDKLPLVECYPGQLNQCLLNILTNAIDAVEALESNHSFNTYRVKRSSLDHTSFEPTSFEPNWNRDRQPTTKQIRISTRVVDYRWIEITIADNGVGVPKGIQGKIFNPFFSTKPIGQGTGMGLSISYQIITEQHGGRLECTSETGEGSTFRILIPIAQTMQNAA
jgi:signal transduction histidine kinase